MQEMKMIVTATGDAELTSLVGLVHAASQEMQKDPRNAKGVLGALRIALGMAKVHYVADDRALDTVSGALLHNLQLSADNGESAMDSAKDQAKAILGALVNSIHPVVLPKLQPAEPEPEPITKEVAATKAKPRAKVSLVKAAPETLPEERDELEDEDEDGTLTPTVAVPVPAETSADDEEPLVDGVIEITDWSIITAANIAKALVDKGEKISQFMHNRNNRYECAYVHGDNIIAGGIGATAVYSITSKQPIGAARVVYANCGAQPGTRPTAQPVVEVELAKAYADIIV